MSLRIPVLVVGLICTLPLCATAAPLDDARLDKAISAHVTMQRLDALLDTVGTECGIKLSADEPAKHEIVQLQCEQQPAKTVLRQLATALTYSWVEAKDAEGKPAYRLVQGIAARQEERANRLRRRLVAAGELNTQLQLLEKYLAKYQNKSRAEVQEDIARLKQAAAMLPVSAEQWAADRDWQVAQLTQEPEAALFAHSFSALPQAARERLFLGERVLLAAQRPEALPMPAAVLEALRRARQYRADQKSSKTERIIVPTGEDEVVAFDASARTGLLTLRLRSNRRGPLPSGPGLTMPLVMLTPSRVEFGPPLADTAEGTVTADRPADLDRPIRFDWHPKVRKADEPWSYARGILPCEVLAALGAAPAGLRVVGNAYWDPVRFARYAPPPDAGAPRMETAEQTLLRLSAEGGKDGQLPLGKLLHVVAERGNTSFHVTRDGWIRCRSTLYFDLRDRSPDPAVVARLFQPVLEKRVYTAISAQEAAVVLTLAEAEQLSHPYLEFLPEFVGFGGLAQNWHGWHLLGNLGPGPRQALAAGKPVAYATLSARDQAAFRVFVQEIATAPGIAPVDLDVGPREFMETEIALSSSTGSQRQLRFTRRGEASPLAVLPIGAQKWD